MTRATAASATQPDARHASVGLPDADQLHDLALERRTVGMLVLSPALLVDVDGLPSLLHFDAPRLVLAAAARCPADRLAEAGIVAVADSLKLAGHLDLIGGHEGLAQFAVDATADGLNFAAGVARLRALSEAREARKVLERTQTAWRESENGSTVPQPSVTQHEPTASYNPTDLGNAERFTRQHGAVVRYVAVYGQWYVWGGKRWAPDRDGEVERLATTTVRNIYAEARDLDDSTERKALAKHARDSEAKGRVSALLELARSMRPIAVVPEKFDQPATDYLLNVENGTIDLRTGELREHRPEDYITRLAPGARSDAAHFAPGKRGARELWDAFLKDQVPDAEVREFLARAAGYSLTGATRDEVLFFVHGPTAAGKSTFVEAIKAALGDYATTAGFETFLRRRGDAGVRDDIARLAGSRMVLSLEVDEGRAFDAAALKNLTGGDTVTARHLYGRHFEFRPAFKLWLVANHQPHANAQDAALWRRVLLVPFTRTVPEDQRDPAMKSTLTQDPAARAAILAWAVQGCLEWQRTGLRPPAAVRIATAAYRASCDHVAGFLADCFEPAPVRVTAKLMQARYAEWCAANGEKPLAGRFLGEALRQHGLTPAKEADVRYWEWPGQQGRQDGKNGELSLVSPSRDDLHETAVLGVPAVPDGAGRRS